MITEHQTTSAANQFFAGDASLPHQKALPQNLLEMYLSNYADKV
ncbi:MAG: hypothetical protein V7K64_29690 [Nostoc sp.]|nr:hypothetical protein [Nostoc sp. JL34]